MTKKEEFNLAVKAFSLMTPVEQGLVLIFFKSSKIRHYLEAWIDSVHKVVKGQTNEAANS